jgi:aspartyl-tRNA(Asn)/glutamyl-tRNA(Gln) amidotransferase subunit A
MGSSKENSCYGPALNPHDSERVSGGSSGGSAAVVAAGQVPLALGSDTGGSVRQPAALCGVIGLKPTYGRVSRWGLVAFGSSFEQIGTLSATVEDAALALQAIAGEDGRDDMCVAQHVPAYRQTIRDGVRGIHVGVWRRALQAGEMSSRVVAAVEAAAQQLGLAGAELHEIDLPLADEALSIYYVLAAAEAASNLARFDGIRYGQRATASTLADTYSRSRGAGLGPEVKRRIMLGTFVSSAGYHDRYYARAQTARIAFKAEFDQLMQRNDLLLMPTAPAPAFRLGEKLQDPMQMYQCDVFTVPASLSGHPAISLPAPRQRHELPVGVQLVARHFEEELLLRAAATLEALGFRGELPE